MRSRCASWGLAAAGAVLVACVSGQEPRADSPLPAPAEPEAKTVPDADEGRISPPPEVPEPNEPLSMVSPADQPGLQLRVRLDGDPRSTDALWVPVCPDAECPVQYESGRQVPMTLQTGGGLHTHFVNATQGGEISAQRMDGGHVLISYMVQSNAAAPLAPSIAGFDANARSVDVRQVHSALVLDPCRPQRALSVGRLESQTHDESLEVSMDVAGAGLACPAAEEEAPPANFTWTMTATRAGQTLATAAVAVALDHEAMAELGRQVPISQMTERHAEVRFVNASDTLRISATRTPAGVLRADYVVQLNQFEDATGQIATLQTRGQVDFGEFPETRTIYRRRDAAGDLEINLAVAPIDFD